MTTLTSPHDLLAAIPFLVGYHPKESLVLVSLKNDAVGMAMRVDYPRSVEGLSVSLEILVGHLSREGADGALIVAYMPDGRDDGVDILQSLNKSLEEAKIIVHESIVIWQNKWRSLLCADQLCCPPEGRELPELETSRIAVEQVANGHPMPFGNAEELTESISSLPLAEDVNFSAEVRSFYLDENSDDLPNLQRKAAVGVIDLASRFISGSIGKDFALDQSLSAAVIGRMTDIHVRDFALGSHAEATADIYWSMWRYLARIAPAGFVAPVASLLAALSYEKGDGALAHRALDRALSDDPTYSLALLLRRVFSAGWPPESFAQMRKDLHPKVCAAIFDGTNPRT
ncbi:MAG: DUF4192 domain-containing protein [Actinomycetota bacterium]